MGANIAGLKVADAMMAQESANPILRNPKGSPVKTGGPFCIKDRRNTEK